jgi:hypothetical protein
MVRNAILVLFLLTLPACRESSVDTSAPVPPATPVLRFSPGDSLTFDTWSLNDFGDRILSTQASLLWRVVDTGRVTAGQQNVTVIIAQAAPGSPPILPDTLLFRFGANGDVFQYGFLFRSVLRREQRTIPRAWDRIGAFSLAAGNVWTVGAQDSAGTDLVQGRIIDDQSYFSAAINGVQTLFRGYSAGLAGTNYEFGCTVAGSPPAMVVEREESGPSSTGTLQILNSLRLRNWP